MKQTGQISQWGKYGLVTVLIWLMMFLMSTTALDLAALSQVKESIHMDDLYQQTYNLVVLETHLIERYYLAPNAQTLNEQWVAENTLVQTLQTIRRDGDRGDDAFLARVLPEQEQFQALTHTLTTAIVIKRVAYAKTLYDEISTISNFLEQQASRARQADHNQTTQSLATLYQTQTTIGVVIIIVFAMSNFLFALFWRQIRTYQYTLDKAAQAKLEEVTRTALIDTLTGLGNRRAYEQEAGQIMEQVLQRQELLGLAIIDIDEFKLINDTYGHTYGDSVLSGLGTFLRNLPNEASVYRLSGDEFVLLVRRHTIEEATDLVKKLCEEAPRYLSGATVSIGIAVSGTTVREIDVLQEQADAALYEAKKGGRHRVAIYEDIQQHTSFISSTKVRAMQRLLAEGHISIAFQPIWEMNSSTPLAFEALSRPDISYGFSGPQEVFDIADRLGHGPQLDQICLSAILGRAKELPSSALLFVNLSPQTLDSDLFEGFKLIQAVHAAGLTPERIVLEITERSILRPEIIVREAKRLRALGFGLALDDTGTGNAGLGMLSQLPVDFVKIDRAVVVRGLSEQSARAVMAGITAIAYETSARVIAEGIENIEMFDFAREMHVQAVQGYFLGRPTQTIPNHEELQRFSPAAQVA